MADVVLCQVCGLRRIEGLLGLGESLAGGLAYTGEGLGWIFGRSGGNLQ